MTREEFINSGLLEEFVLGLTNENQDHIVMEHLELYPDLCQQLKKWEFSLEEMARKNAITPPSDVKNKLQQKLDLHDTKEARSLKKFPTSSILKSKMWLNIAAAYLLLSILGLAYFVNQNLNLTKESRQLAIENAKLLEEKEDLLLINKKYSFVKDKETQVLQFESNSIMVGTVFINHKLHKTSFKVNNLAPPPPQKVYQMWADIDGEMVDMGVLYYPKNEELLELPYMENATSLNITIEPLGGSNTPTVANLVSTVTI